MAESLIDISNKASASVFQKIPIIDFCNIRSNDPMVKRSLADEVREACFTAGFFYVKNHGIPENIIEDAVTAGRQFFALPMETKMKIEHHLTPTFMGYFPLADPKKNKDTYEFFSIQWEPKGNQNDNSESSGTNIWPSEEDVPGFKEKVLKYYHHVFELAKLMFPLFALALNESEDLFDDKTRNFSPKMNLLHYPPKTRPNQTGLRPHTDWDFFTILYQEAGKQALQILNADNEWIDAPAIPGTFVINIADQLSLMTNGIFKSTKHQAISDSGHDRFSIPLFVGIDEDAKLEPIPSCVSPERPWKYDGPLITAGEHVKARLKTNYA